MKVKIELEFPINSSPQLLYQYLSTPSGLTEWFADDVSSVGDIYSFYWGDSVEKAKMTSKKLDEKVRFRWLDENEKETDSMFELKIDRDELTKDVVLVVVDMCEEDEVEDQEMLWQNQINDLKIVLGSV